MYQISDLKIKVMEAASGNIEEDDEDFWACFSVDKCLHEAFGCTCNSYVHDIDVRGKFIFVLK